MYGASLPRTPAWLVLWRATTFTRLEYEKHAGSAGRHDHEGHDHSASVTGRHLLVRISVGVVVVARLVRSLAVFVRETTGMMPALLIGSLVAGGILTIVPRDVLVALGSNPVWSVLALMRTAFTTKTLVQVSVLVGHRRQHAVGHIRPATALRHRLRRVGVPRHEPIPGCAIDVRVRVHHGLAADLLPAAGRTGCDGPGRRRDHAHDGLGNDQEAGDARVPIHQ